MLGTDYEVFVINRQTGDAVSAAIFGLNGKRGEHNPLMLKNKQVGTIHRDNLMLEICPPPAETSVQFASCVKNTLLAAQNFVREFNEDFIISRIPEAQFSFEDLDTHEARDIGCDRDFVSFEFSSSIREAVTARTLRNCRYAGGHVHVSYDTALAPPWVAAMLCDLFIGLPVSELLNAARAPYYGLASLHRPTEYPDGTRGVEYRVLDSFWVHEPHAGVIKSLGTVQALLTAEYVDAVGQLVDVHLRSISPKTPLCQIPNKKEIVNSVSEVMRMFAPKIDW